MNLFYKEVGARTSSFLDKTVDFPIEAREDFTNFPTLDPVWWKSMSNLTREIVYKMS